MPTLEANQMLLAAADACDSKKAEDIRILALDPSESSLTDYFLICSGTNERQNAAIADEIDIRLKKEFGVLPNAVEGKRQGEWVLMDYVDFVVHIFMPEKREFYGLERLRKTAKTISVAELSDEIRNAIAKTRAKGATAKKAAAKKTPAKAVTKTVANKAVKKSAAIKPTKAAKKATNAPAKKSVPAAKKAAKKVAKKAPKKK